MGMFLILFAVVVVAVVIFTWINAGEKAKRNKNFIENLKNFNSSQSLENISGDAGIALDELGYEICLWTYKNNDFEERRLKYQDIISVEILEDDISIIKTDRVSQIGGALVGGVLLGGVGAAVGALSGKKQSSTGKVKKLDLKITINDTRHPIFIISKLNSEASTDGFLYKTFKEQLEHWHGVFEAIIKKSEQETNKSNASGIHAQSSTFEELKKISELKESGILTDEEFHTEKQKILNRN